MLIDAQVRDDVVFVEIYYLAKLGACLGSYFIYHIVHNARKSMSVVVFTASCLKGSMQATTQKHVRVEKVKRVRHI